MTRRESLFALLTPAFLPRFLRAEAVNLTGTWDLDIEQSDWGNKDKPVSAHVEIQHSEPALRYEGAIVTGTEGESRRFEFDGAVDGKERAITGGNMVVRRVDDRTITSEYKSADGRTVETTRTTISEDGKRLTRRVHAQGPTGTFAWTEVYKRR
jgi:hypothetical protein